MNSNHRFRDAAQKARWEKEKHLEWFHKVTGGMTDDEIIEACLKRNLADKDQSIHAMQTALLQAGPEPESNQSQ